jgi:hypothetical protein
MSEIFWKDGKCHICNTHSIAKCDGCDKFTCESHSRKLKQGNIRLDICNKCLKSLKPGMKVAGVKITEKTLEM